MSTNPFYSREEFLKGFGGTVAPELFPHLWLDVPPPSVSGIRALPPNVLHIRPYDSKIWQAITEIWEIRDDTVVEHVDLRTMGSSKIRRIRGAQHTTVTMRGALGPNDGLLQNTFNRSRGTDKFAISLSDMYYEFDAMVTQLSHVFGAVEPPSFSATFSVDGEVMVRYDA